jgi:thiol-disulfide isomerase/thioredoxin
LHKILVCSLLLWSAVGLAQKKFISAKLTGFNNGDKARLYSYETAKLTDSTFVSDGKFSIPAVKNETPFNYSLTIESNGKFYRLPLFIANENIAISGDKNDFTYNSKISGSKSQAERNIILNQIKPLERERDSLSKYFWPNESDTSATYKSLRKEKLQRYDEIIAQIDVIRMRYIRGNTNSYSALYELFYLRSNFDRKELGQLYKRLDEKHAKSVYGEKILNYLEVGEPLKEGDPFFDFTAQDRFGKPHRLSEIKGRYILLDFNETYCKPCVLSVKELRKVNSVYKDKLQIVGFCADKQQSTWLKGLDRDKPDWINLWDGGTGTSGKTLLKYGIEGYPTFLLINPEGKIVAVEIGFENGAIENMLKANIR